MLNRLSSFKKNDDSDDVEKTFEEIQSKNDFDIIAFFPSIKKLLEGINQWNREAFLSQLRMTLGIDLRAIVERDNVRESFKMAIDQNFSLIKSLSDSQINRLKNTVYTALRQGKYDAKELIKNMSNDFGITNRRAKLIARDQALKIGASLNKIRYENVGITSYKWRNVRDSRVRGNPKGLYPDSKYNHWEREGKTYNFNKPPADGNPGEPINCRCHAEPIIDHLINKGNVYE